VAEIEMEFRQVIESSYIPQDISFDRKQTLYLLAYLFELRAGIKPFASLHAARASRNRNQTPFIFWCEVAAELDIRLAHTEEDSYFIEDFCCKRISIAMIAQQRHKSVWEVRRRIESAISYIASGWVGRWKDTKRRKGISYKEWKKHHVR